MDARPHGADESAEDHPAEPAESLADDLSSGDPRGPGSAPLPHDGSGAADSRRAGADGRPDGPDDTDAEWQDLVARLRAMGDPDPQVPGPDAEAGGSWAVDSGTGTGARPFSGDPTGDDARHRAGDLPPPAEAPVAPRGWSPDPAVEEAENHFSPPDPGPVLGGDPLLTLAWTAVVSVPLALLLVVMLWPDAPAVVLQVAGAVFACGLGLLLWRMPHGDDDEPRGSGAVV